MRLEGERVRVTLSDPLGGTRTYLGTRSLLEPSLTATLGDGEGNLCAGSRLPREALHLSFETGTDPRAAGELSSPHA